MLRANSRLHQRLSEAQRKFLEFATGAVQRLLPHIQVTAWEEGIWRNPQSVWTSANRTEVRMTIAVGAKNESEARSLTAIVRRRRSAFVGSKAKAIIDLREHDICRLIAQRVTEILKQQANESGSASIEAISDSFDEYIVGSHIQGHHKFQARIAPVLSALHTLSEQSYENKALTFGCIIDPGQTGEPSGARFPSEFLRSKKYKALSDGFRTAYIVSTDGRVLSFVDLEKYGTDRLTEKHYFPDWTEAIAQSSRHGRCGIALSRQGDILVFDEGTLRFTYRYGRWQYWNHSHLLNLLRDQARAQRVPSSLIGRVVGAIYRAALDVSFRRSGGLFVVLHNRNHLRKIVKHGDAIGDQNRSATDGEFDTFLKGHTIQSLPRAVAVELASLDGAVVLDNSGHILAYGAVLQPKKAGKLRGTEGSRTKAAIGASNYGLAVKVSSDGDISVYNKGSEFIRV
jgi:hypothetical protein